MKKINLIILSALIFFLNDSFAHAERPVHFHFGLFPVAFIIAPDADGFKALNPIDSTTIQGDTLYSPGAFIGVDYDTNKSGVGLDVFDSYFYSSDLTGNVLGINVSYIFPHRERSMFKVKLKGGILKGSLDWESSNNKVVFDDADGWQAGLSLDAGKTVLFYGELLYRDLEYDVALDESDTVNRTALDFSGMAINLGIKFSF